jgi:hypothetical protein
MVLASDKMSGLRKPILILKLETSNPNGNTEQTIIELSGEELNAFLAQLRVAQKV